MFEFDFILPMMIPLLTLSKFWAFSSLSLILNSVTNSLFFPPF